ncbi:Ribonuclease P protein subunit p25-like protein [Ananas comosus]|uniref:Ribonuclease P protein subunit p25-like protein n=1 Tax=Ananas comosus TaxID=4615 RepID=A0A199VLC3_ANACO|nr:Ribonuclease P protein subunit p25-like protein [Ananas comosus]
MDRYQKVEKPREETPIKENEIRITTQGRMRSYITYASSLLQEKGSNEIVFKAMGRAINKTIMIVELIKRRIVGLHQNTAIGSTDITDTWEPLEEGLLPLETTRHVSMITITLSKSELDKSSVGYQPPLPADLVKPMVEFDYEGGRLSNIARAHLLVGGEAVVVVVGEGLVAMVRWTMVMEVMTTTAAVGMVMVVILVEEAVVSGVVAEEVAMVAGLVISKKLVTITRRRLFPTKAEGVVAGGGKPAVEAGAVNLIPTVRSKQIPPGRNLLDVFDIQFPAL